MAQKSSGGEKPDTASGAWIRMDTDLEDTEEFSAILVAVGLHKQGRAGVQRLKGVLQEFWGWFDRRTALGFMPHVTGEVVDARVDLPGFAAAMVAVDWLILTERGAEMPKFSKRHAKSEKSRMAHSKAANDSKRAKAERAALGIEDAAESPPECIASAAPQSPTRSGSASKAQPTRTRSAADSLPRGCQGAAESLPTPCPTTTTTKTNTPSSKSLQGSRVRGRTDDDDEEELRSEGGVWENLLDQVAQLGVNRAAHAVASARRNRVGEELVAEILDEFREHGDHYGGPAALYIRLTEKGPEFAADRGWIKPPPERRAPKPPSVVFLDRVDVVMAERGCGNSEAMEIVDAEYRERGERSPMRAE